MFGCPRWWSYLSLPTANRLMISWRMERGPSLHSSLIQARSGKGRSGSWCRGWVCGPTNACGGWA
uniref:Uncharacterized protein n=1 Tax=Anguilla anguilla TaxID=7936 RepID=A0A0E9WXC3_ANGAN